MRAPKFRVLLQIWRIPWRIVGGATTWIMDAGEKLQRRTDLS